jgi:galactokinase/mevalonate kinase-like predicted kinase
MELEFGTWLYYYYLTKVSTVLASTIDKEAILLVYFNKNDEIISHSFREKNNINRLSNIETERHENNTQGNLLQEIMKGLDVAPATR